jgi:hypothetical protein
MPLLQPRRSQAPASAPINPEGATGGPQPDEPREILIFGKPERRSPSFQVASGDRQSPRSPPESSSAAWHWQWLFLPATMPPPAPR